MSFDSRNRPLLLHMSPPEAFLENAKRHPVFDPFVFRPLTAPVAVATLWEALEMLRHKGTSGPHPYVFSSAETKVSGALLASTITIGSLQRIQIEDIVLVSNPRIRHAVANTVRAFLENTDATVEICFWGIANDGWKHSLMREFNYSEHHNRACVSITNA